MNSKKILLLLPLMTLCQLACDSPGIVQVPPPEAPTTMVAAGDTPPPGADSPAGVPIVLSSGFRRAADGVYEWDGRPPVGDLGPARIYSPRTLVDAPGLASGIQLGGSVYGDFKFDGDQSKIKLIFSAYDESGSALFFDREKGHDYRYCDDVGWGRCTGADDYEKEELNLDSYPCGVRVQMGGTGWARKALPFGIGLGRSILRLISLGAPSTWGEVSLPLPASTRSGPPCSPTTPVSPPGDGGPVAPPSPTPYYPPPPSGSTTCTYTYEWEITYFYGAGHTLILDARLINSSWSCV